MPKTPIVQGFMPLTLLSACTGGQRPAKSALNESQPAACATSPNAKSAEARAKTRRTGKIQVRAASRFGYAGFVANQARTVAIRDRCATLAGAAS